jgi:hypothetical protein
MVLSPHIWWLYQNNFAPFDYALNAHGDKSLPGTTKAAALYLLGTAAYIATPLIIVALAFTPNAQTVREMAWPSEPNRRTLAIAFWLPLLMPVVVALASGLDIHATWTMSDWSLFPILLLAPVAVTISNRSFHTVMGVAIVFPLVMLIVSPAIALGLFVSGKSGWQTQQLAGEVQRIWSSSFRQPLRFVDGDADLAYSVEAYEKDHPRAIPGLPPRDESELTRSGMIAICHQMHGSCVARLEPRLKRNPATRRINIALARTYLGMRGAPHQFVIFVLPPQP